MKPMHTLWLVTRREVSERLRSKAFIISGLFTVVLVVAVLTLPTLLAGGPQTYELGLVGEGGEPIVDTARRLAAAEEEEVTIETRVFDDVEQAEAAVEADEVAAVLVAGEELVVPGGSGLGGSDLLALLQRAAASSRIESLVAEDDSVAEVVQILASEPLEVRSLSGPDSEENESRFFVAYGGLVLMYIAVLTFGVWTLTGVSEEKTNRVVEVLLATVQPWQLLAGKILGIGLLGISQFVVTVAAALVTISLTGSLELPQAPIGSFLVLVLWFVLGYAIFSVAFGAAGALVSRAEDAQSSSAPLSLIAIVGFFASFQVIDDPTGPVALIGTVVPFTAPFVVPVRFAFGAIPAWQMALAVIVAVTSVYGLVRLGGRVYAGGLLRTGGKVSWREAFRSAEL